MYRLMIGSNNTTKIVETKKVLKVVGKYTLGFTTYNTKGYWQGKPEKSMIVEIADIRPMQVRKLAKELCHTLRQDAVGLQRIEGATRFISNT